MFTIIHPVSAALFWCWTPNVSTFLLKHGIFLYWKIPKPKPYAVISVLVSSPMSFLVVGIGDERLSDQAL